MRAVILAGRLGTRLSEETETRPRPGVEIGPGDRNGNRIVPGTTLSETHIRAGFAPEGEVTAYPLLAETHADRRVPLDEGLRKTVPWYSSFLNTRAAA